MYKIAELYHAKYGYMRYFQFLDYLMNKYKTTTGRDPFYATNEEIEEFAKGLM